ncbi:ribbon-helix-helix protein, CopG family [Mesorhizobium sp. VNQ89]|uniref:plasmid mobilization protein n=1 Tax=Mesorhizobium quangtriensis TaxID=3157709 RepID=UPI0032B70AAE
MRLAQSMDKQIRVRVSQDEKAALRALARARGVSLSQLLRDGAIVSQGMVAAA